MFTNFIIPAYSVFHESWNWKTFTKVTAPKSTESTNSTMPAYSSIFTRGGTRGGAFRLIHDLKNRWTCPYSIFYLRYCHRAHTDTRHPSTKKIPHRIRNPFMLSVKTRHAQFTSKRTITTANASRISAMWSMKKIQYSMLDTCSTTVSIFRAVVISLHFMAIPPPAFGLILACAKAIVNAGKTRLLPREELFCSCQRNWRHKSGKFVHLYLTFRDCPCKIYTVLCTLAVNIPQRFIDNRRKAGGNGFLRLYKWRFLLNRYIFGCQNWVLAVFSWKSRVSGPSLCIISHRLTMPTPPSAPYFWRRRCAVFLWNIYLLQLVLF